MSKIPDKQNISMKKLIPMPNHLCCFLQVIFLFSIFIIIITILNQAAKVHISKKVCNT
ncbi:Uncharacterised protein [Segatella copri]|nr:Uncharacterised protein [Segatella copri]